MTAVELETFEGSGQCATGADLCGAVSSAAWLPNPSTWAKRDGALDALGIGPAFIWWRHSTRETRQSSSSCAHARNSAYCCLSCSWRSFCCRRRSSMRPQPQIEPHHGAIPEHNMHVKTCRCSISKNVKHGVVAVALAVPTISRALLLVVLH